MQSVCEQGRSPRSLVHTMAMDRPVFHLCSAAVCGQQELPSQLPVCCQLHSNTPAELSPSCAPLRCAHTPQTPALSHEGRNELLVAEGTVTYCCFFRGLLLGDRPAPMLGQVSRVCPACPRRALPPAHGTRASCCSAPCAAQANSPRRGWCWERSGNTSVQGWSDAGDKSPIPS